MVCRLIHTAQCVQAAGITDKGQALRDNLNQEWFIISNPHIDRSMGGKLWFAASLCSQKTKSNHFSLSVIQSAAGVIIAKAVVSQPVIDMSAFLRSRLKCYNKVVTGVANEI